MKPVSPSAARELEQAAVRIARSKMAGGRQALFFKKKYLDAAFNGGLFLWDTCMIAAWAKYYVKDLPIITALDNFYRMQDKDGFMCREYLPDGRVAWDKAHPIAVAPPILAWAEVELFTKTHNRRRLQKVYPALARFHRYMENTYRGDDGLYWSDAHGSGMDNIPRMPRGWSDDGHGVRLNFNRCHPSVRPWIRGVAVAPHLRGTLAWNRQGRSVDLTAQMALDAAHLSWMADVLGLENDAHRWEKEKHDINARINTYCWSSKESFYFDLAYGKKIIRRHIGMFWTLWSGAAEMRKQQKALIKALLDPSRFGRPVPVPSMAADEPEYCRWGDYWRGGVWPPTTYMILRGLRVCGEDDVARKLARQFYDVVASVHSATGTFWENYAPEFPSYGIPARPDFCGWTGLVPVSIYREYLAE
jgi:hypothetical protein